MSRKGKERMIEPLREEEDEDTLRGYYQALAEYDNISFSSIPNQVVDSVLLLDDEDFTQFMQARRLKHQQQQSELDKIVATSLTHQHVANELNEFSSSVDSNAPPPLVIPSPDKQDHSFNELVKKIVNDIHYEEVDNHLDSSSLSGYVNQIEKGRKAMMDPLLHDVDALLPSDLMSSFLSDKEKDERLAKEIINLVSAEQHSLSWKPLEFSLVDSIPEVEDNLEKSFSSWLCFDEEDCVTFKDDEEGQTPVLPSSPRTSRLPLAPIQVIDDSCVSPLRLPDAVLLDKEPSSLNASPSTSPERIQLSQVLPSSHVSRRINKMKEQVRHKNELSFTVMNKGGLIKKEEQIQVLSAIAEGPTISEAVSNQAFNKETQLSSDTIVTFNSALIENYIFATSTPERSSDLNPSPERSKHNALKRKSPDRPLVDYRLSPVRRRLIEAHKNDPYVVTPSPQSPQNKQNHNRD